MGGLNNKYFFLTVLEPGKSKTCSVGSQVGDTGEPVVHMKSEGSQLTNSLLREDNLLVLYRPSTD